MRVRIWVGSALLVLLSAAPLMAQPRPAIDAHLATTPPQIDGVIGEREWGEPIAAGDWLSYNPLHGDRVPQQTTVWISYDADALYFAFRCDDPEPGNIKTSITRREHRVHRGRARAARFCSRCCAPRSSARTSWCSSAC